MAHRLLLADDSVTIQRVIELTFADEDIDVVVVGDGRQAIEKVRAQQPDIVLADVAMPERDGYEVAAFVKGDPALAHIPVVLLTGAFEPIDENRARSVGCDGVLVKPFEPQMVINRVKELLAGRRAPAPPPAPVQPAVQAAPATAPALALGDFDSDFAPHPRADAAPPPEDAAIEDYFDRLDAAFATLGAAPAPAPAHEDITAALGELHQPPPERTPSSDTLTGWDPELTAAFGPAQQPHFASAFAALLAAEESGADVDPALGVAGPAVLGEDAIEDIVQRVLARLGDDSMRRLLVETAERVVREEIDRIKASAAPGAGGDFRVGP